MEQDKIVQELQGQVEKYDGSFAIATPSDYEKAALVLKETKGMLKLVDEKEKEVTKPLNEGLKKARGLFKPMKDRLNLVVSKLNSNMFSFRREQEEEARKEQAKIDAEKKPDDLFVPEVEVKVPKVEGLKVRKNWKFKVVDKEKVNKQFLIVDEKSVGEIVRSMKEKAVGIVGGIEVYCEETTY